VAAERVRSLGRLLYILEQRALSRASAVVGGLATTDPSPEYQAGVAAAVARLNDLALGERGRQTQDEVPPAVE